MKEDKAIEYRIGRWYETPEYEDTITLKEDTDLQKVHLAVIKAILPWVKLE
jgi:hypothetical protein